MWREWIELRGEIIGDDAGVVAGNVRGREDIELRQRRHLVIKGDFLAITQPALCSGEGCVLPCLREQAIEVGNDALCPDAGPEGFHAAGVTFVAGLHAQIIRRIQRVVGVVAAAHRSLVGHDEDVAQSAELLRDRRDVGVAEQDVLVFFLHKFIARGHNHFDHVLASRKHRQTTGPIRTGRWIRYAFGAIRAVWLSVCVHTGNARELIHAVVRRGLELCPVVHAVIALELGVVENRLSRRSAVLGVVHVQVAGLVFQREVERITGSLARAVHVRNTGGAETLSPLIPTGSLRGIYQGQTLAAIGSGAFFIEIDGYVRNTRLPAQLQQHGGIIKRTSRSIDDVATNAAVLAWVEWLLSEFQELVLSGEALPAIRSHSWRIDAAGGTSSVVTSRAVGSGAIPRARKPQVQGQGIVFQRSGVILPNRRVSAGGEP